MLRRVGVQEEFDLLATGLFARAGGPAIDPGGTDPVDERVVVTAVARQHDAPAALGGWVGNDSGTAHAIKVARCRAAFYPIFALEVAFLCVCASVRLAYYLQGSSAVGP